jgi:hypothetical protein
MLFRSTVKALLGAMLSACALANPAPPAATASSGLPAIWQQYDILVHLIALPQRYSCDELWSKFRAVLVRLGAGEVEQITPEDCATHSPSVHVRFVLPHQDMAAQFRDINAAMSTVDLGPDNPMQLQESDCRLVQQMEESLLTDLPIKVVSARFDCDPGAVRAGQHTSPFPAEPRHSYALSVRALMPMWPQRAASATLQPGS